MQLKQYRLRNKKTGQEEVFWLDKLDLKVGNQVTLKDWVQPKDWWIVISASGSNIDDADIKGGHKSKSWYKKDYLYKIGNKK